MATHDRFRRLCDPGTPTGRNAEAVRRRIMSSCEGWGKRPTPAEFYDAIRVAKPTNRQQSIVHMWGLEATTADLLEAWVQRAYTLRELVQALHRADFACGARIRVINQWARRS